MGKKKAEIDACIEKTSCPTALLRESDIKQLYAQNNKEDAINIIIARNSPFVLRHAYAWKYSADKYGVDFQDLISAGKCALIKATRNYDSGKGSYFRYAGQYISSFIQAEFYKLCGCPRLEGKRRHKSHERINIFESLSQEIANNGEDEPLTLEDVIAQPDDECIIPMLEVRNLLQTLKKENGKIHPLASDIIEMRYGIGSKYAEEPCSLQKTAEELNISKEGVRKIENRALAYLSSISK